MTAVSANLTTFMFKVRTFILNMTTFILKIKVVRLNMKVVSMRMKVVTSRTGSANSPPTRLTVTGGVELELVDQEGVIVKTVRTAYDGFYDITEIRPGGYPLSVTAEHVVRLRVVAPSRGVKILPSCADNERQMGGPCRHRSDNAAARAWSLRRSSSLV